MNHFTKTIWAIFKNLETFLEESRTVLENCKPIFKSHVYFVFQHFLKNHEYFSKIMNQISKSMKKCIS
jgi:hypothetical protein